MELSRANSISGMTEKEKSWGMLLLGFGEALVAYDVHI